MKDWEEGEFDLLIYLYLNQLRVDESTHTHDVDDVLRD